MIKPTTATTQMLSTARASDRGAAVRDRLIGDDGLALRVIAAAVRAKLHERDLLDENLKSGRRPAEPDGAPVGDRKSTTN
jgi:hypothetical protein